MIACIRGHSCIHKHIIRTHHVCFWAIASQAHPSPSKIESSTLNKQCECIKLAIRSTTITLQQPHPLHHICRTMSMHLPLTLKHVPHPHTRTPPSHLEACPPPSHLEARPIPVFVVWPFPVVLQPAVMAELNVHPSPQELQSILSTNMVVSRVKTRRGTYSVTPHTVQPSPFDISLTHNTSN